MKQPLTTSTKNLTIEGQIIKQPQTIRANNDKLLTRGAKIKTTLNNRNKKMKATSWEPNYKNNPKQKEKNKATKWGPNYKNNSYHVNKKEQAAN